MAISKKEEIQRQKEQTELSLHLRAAIGDAYMKELILQQQLQKNTQELAGLFKQLQQLKSE